MHSCARVRALTHTRMHLLTYTCMHTHTDSNGGALQDGVPQTIFDLRRAGIKVWTRHALHCTAPGCIRHAVGDADAGTCMAAQVWMLTGDKVGTAINIGKMCRLISDDMAVVDFTVPK